MRSLIPAMLLLLFASAEAGRAAPVLPLEIRQELTTYNLQSRRGVPISTVVSNPPGSDGRMPTANESFGSSNLPTTNQFSGLISFGAIPGLTSNNWVTVSNTAGLKAGTNAFSGLVADTMKLPVGKSNNIVVMVMRRAQVGAPYFIRPISFPFGSIVSVPNTDIFGALLTNMVPAQYWQAEPYSLNNHLNAPYYWSPHARTVFAVEPGPILITWRKTLAYTAGNLPAYTNLNGSQTFVTNGASIYALYTARYVVSGSAVKPPRKIYWTEGAYQALGKPVDVPAARVQDLKIVYTAAFPEFVSSNEVVMPPGLPYVPGLSDRTLYYDVSSKQIRANNLRGRAFLELLGDARGDGSREHLGFEIVDVFREPSPADVTIELGEQLTPPSSGSIEELLPEAVSQASSYAYQHNIAGSDRIALYAAQRTYNINDYMVHWMEEGLQGLKWPALFARYQLVWPDAIDRYSLYLRPVAATEEAAKTTAVALATENVPIIQYQDPLDRPRAKLTEQFKFYTWLDTNYPAHRTLLRFSSGENIAFERVFSWLDVNLKSTNFTGSVAEELSAWNPANRTFNWPDDLSAPRMVSATVNVGERITAPAGERGTSAGEPYLAGHINVRGGVLYDPFAYTDPFVNGFEVANLGAIIPVNAIPGSNTLEVWWFRLNTNNAGPNAGDPAQGFRTIYWPSAIGRYTLQWPNNAPEIVLASKLGSGTLDTFQAQGRIYVQNNAALPGYNPNEEHAIMAGGTAYATRDDLNITNTTDGLAYSSHPFVLVEFVAEDGRPAITAFQVRRESPEAGYVFDYIVPAGQMLQPPMPLPLLGKPVDSTGYNFITEPTDQSGDLPMAWDEARDANGPYAHYQTFTYRDRHDDFWVYRGPHAGLPTLQAGKYNPTNRTWGPLPSARAVVGQPFSLTVHASRQDEYLKLSALTPLPAWLTTNGLTLQALPGRPVVGDVATTTLSLVVEDTYEGSRVTNTLNLAVSTTGIVTGQTALVLSSVNPFTGTTVNYSNRPPFLALSPAPTNSFTMRYYYKTEPSFAWPGISAPPPAGSIVPYLRQYDSTNGVFLGGTGTSTESRPLDIVYRPVWPQKDPKDASKPLPTLRYGATLANPAFGLPGVRDMRTAHVLYQQSIAANLTNAQPSAVLHDPTRAKIALLPPELPELPSSVKTDAYQGKYYFPNLPPHLAQRLYFDPYRGDHGGLVLEGKFIEEITGQSYLLLNVLRGSDLDAVIKLCAAADPAVAAWASLVSSLATTVETFVEDPGVPGSFIPDPAQSVSVAVQDLAEVRNDETAVDSYALSATGPGTGYVILLEASGQAFTEPGDPVAMHIFKVGGWPLEQGELKIIAAANPLSEMVTFQHTADLAGRFDEYDYEWRIAAPVDGAPPANESDYSNLSDITNSLPCYTLGGAGIQALSDNYVIMRYRPNNPAHPLYTNWSLWTEPKLAEGWIKRVLAGINPFNQRVTDLFNNRVNTDVSILTQAGHRWEGDVALNLDTMNNYGLIEIYETVLRRGRGLSIESGFNYGPANDALLLAAGYLSDLYMMEGNEAWADAANPTIGIGTKDSTYGDIATALFAFKGQVPSVLEEELALLRGRDDFTQPGVGVAPIYNRLFWNYTRGIDAGEVIYANNYNIQENPNAQPDGIINAEDAAYMYPQGHGDAYGHYLTALKGYYSLLLNSYFDWVPRTEAVNVLGQPVQVDYQDERKFAAAAAAVARAGRQIFDLTWRKDYEAIRSAGWEHFGTTRENTQRTVPTTRYWGLDHWACRSGQGAYLNWVVGNAILPDVDPNPAHEGIQKIDRTTVPELQELTTIAQGLQTALDNAEGSLSPLGLPEDAVALDINPSAVVGTENGTHFEQIYQRAKVALNNALAAFDDAKDVTRLMRSEQDSLAEMQASVAKQELAYNNALIEIYGSPYPDDLGPGKTYKQDYTGPDLLHYMYVDQPELNFPSVWNFETNLEFKIDLQTVPEDWVEHHYTDFEFIRTRQDGDYDLAASIITYNLSPHGYFEKPTAWTSKRPSPGKLQQAISELILAHGALRQALFNSSGGKDDLDKAIALFEAEVANHDQIRDIQTGLLIAEQGVESAKFAGELFDESMETAEKISNEATEALKEVLPDVLIVGLANGGDMTFGARAALQGAKAAKTGVLKGIQYAAHFVLKTFEFANETAKRWTEFSGIQPLEWNQELRGKVMELSAKLFELQGNLWTINERLRQLDDAQAKVRAIIAEGERLQAERETYRKRASAVVQGYRTRDAAFRIFRTEKLERYKTLFDLSARYSLLAANTYDYETGLLNTPAGQSFVQRIIQARALGVVRNGEPQYAGSNTGDPGLSSALAEMKADWDVLRGRLGFNNPDAYGTTVSLRTECLRILPSSDGDANWNDALHLARLDNLLEDQDVRRFCMQIDPGDGLPVPGLLLTFNTTIGDGFNLFGRELAAGDHAFSPSAFATKIFAVGVALEGYRGMDDPPANLNAGGNSPSDPDLSYLDPLALSATPYLYLIPVGLDSMRSPPLGDVSTIRSWAVNDVAIPMPFNLGDSDFSSGQLWQSEDSLTEPLFAIRKHQAFRPVSTASLFSGDLYGPTGTLVRSQWTNNRLVGRSVWNSQWKLVIPGKTLLANPNEGLDRFLKTVRDIKLHFVTYSYSGN